MQVRQTFDIEDALRSDIAAHLGGSNRVFAPPIPPDLRAGDVLVTALGGFGVSASSDSYDVSVDAYADTYAGAAALADAVRGVLVSLPLRDTAVQYSNADANAPYENHDPRAPQLARRTFRATVVCPGQKIQFNE